MLLLEFEHQVDTMYVSVSDETETSGLLSALVLENHAVLNVPKVAEVTLEALQFQVVWKATYEYFAQLGVDLISTTRQRPFAKLLHRCQLLLVLHYLITCLGFSFQACRLYRVNKVCSTTFNPGLRLCIRLQFLLALRLLLLRLLLLLRGDGHLLLRA